MQQRVDGWQEPEMVLFSAEMGAAAGAGAGADAKTDWLELRRGAGKEVPLQLPWLETSRGFRDFGAVEGIGVAGRRTQSTDPARRTHSAHPIQFEPRPTAGNEVPSGATLRPILADGLPSLLHDTRNMVAAMDLYCDLLEEPGVLATPFRHYAQELRLVARASRRLLENLTVAEEVSTGISEVVREAQSGPARERILERVLDFGRFAHPLPFAPESGERRDHGDEPRTLSRQQRARATGQPVESLADELLANHSLLSALAGPAVTVGLTLLRGNRQIAMNGDDLTRVLVNLTRNAAEIMPDGGHIQIALEEVPRGIQLSFTDNGPGIPDAALDTIFSPGFSTHVHLGLQGYSDGKDDPGSRSGLHRGLGLSIVRSLVAAAGGTVRAENRIQTEGHGASFILEFPLEPYLTP